MENKIKELYAIKGELSTNIEIMQARLQAINAEIVKKLQIQPQQQNVKEEKITEEKK